MTWASASEGANRSAPFLSPERQSRSAARAWATFVSEFVLDNGY
jgi:hypothetical protein